MYCQKCGKPLDPDALFCPSCGRPVKVPPPPQPTPPAPPPPPTQVKRSTSGLAVASMILGILSILSPLELLPASILAIIFACITKRQKKGGGIATAGLVCGIVGACFAMLTLLQILCVYSVFISEPHDDINEFLALPSLSCRLLPRL